MRVGGVHGVARARRRVRAQREEVTVVARADTHAAGVAVVVAAHDAARAQRAVVCGGRAGLFARRTPRQGLVTTAAAGAAADEAMPAAHGAEVDDDARGDVRPGDDARGVRHGAVGGVQSGHRVQ